MDKTAQKRSILNKLRDVANIPAERLTGFFRPEHERVMNSLRQLDDQIRAELTGKEIGGIQPMAGPDAAKNLLKEARKNFLRNEFMTGISELAAFHRKMSEVVKEINKFYIDVNKIHHKFLFEGSNDEKLQRMRSHMERKAELELAAMMMKEAGVMDFVQTLHNVFTPRGRALSAWVKKYPKETKALREQGIRLVEAGQALFENTLEILKRMATARATRRPDAYMDEANKIKAEFAKFDSGDKGFTAYYHNVVMPFLKIKDEMDAKRKEQEELEKANKPEVDPTAPPGGRVELGEEPPAAPSTTTTAPTTTAPMGTWMTVNVPGAGAAPAPAAPPGPPAGVPPGVMSSPPAAPAPRTEVSQTEIPPAPDTERSLPPTMTHRRFMESLESMSGESPQVLARYIAKYASSIQEKDTETAIKLFKLAKQIKG